ncbi:MAG: hypothetical protein GY771_17595 [bacterium]|nr:hypothetical protein [bacterium]
MGIDKAVWFRVDAGPDIGMGHLARCLALAARFAEVGNCRAVASHVLS